MSTSGKTEALYVNRNKWQIHHGVEFDVKMPNLDSMNNSMILYVKDCNMKKFPLALLCNSQCLQILHC